LACGNNKHGDWIAKTPGCEDYATVAKTNVSTCCASLPTIKWSAADKCKSECGKKGMCCIVDCELKNQQLVDASGKLDAAKVKEMVKTLVKDAKYVSRQVFFL
jgi:hypothetical protein